MKKLETKRTILRGFEQSDLDDLYEYAKVEDVGEAAGWPHHKNKEESQEILNKFIESGEVYAIVLKENNKVIGSIGIHERKLYKEYNYGNKKTIEIGYVLNKDYWGQGLMTEIAKKAIDYCFNDLKLDVVLVAHAITNARSRGVIEKCGFTFCTDTKLNQTQQGNVVDGRIYDLKKENYFQKNK